MSTSEALARDLPRLRRYARALTGAQASGDAYVEATLEALVEDPSALDGPLGGRVALYKAFTRIWNSISVNGAPGDGVRSAAEHHLAGLDPLPRQAFLLTAVEGFDEAQTAEILGRTVAEVRQLVEACGRELAAEIATDVLIIEDEPMIAVELESLVVGLGHSPTGIARTHAEAVKLAAAKAPGLILADIRLADRSSGIDAVNELLESFEVPVIFITAYPERLLTGERPEPAFLVTKPFEPAMVSAIISQALFFARKAKKAKRPPVEA
ncbi:MAG TPA: response regulator [Bauldia sp.]|mgnify:CR=1 FL=1|nr:response regulator [Bauldia sp.]